MSGTMNKLPPPLQTELERAKTVNDTKMSLMQIQELKAMHGQVLSDVSRMTDSAKKYDQRNETDTFDSGRHEHALVELEYLALVEQEKELSALLISKEEQAQNVTNNNGCRTYFESLGPIAAYISNPSPYKPPHLIQLEKAQIQVAMKKQELIMLGYAYVQAGEALDEMAIKDGKEDERDRKDSFVLKDGSPGRDQMHAERKHTYRSSVEKQQKMHDILMEKVIALQNALMEHEQEIYHYYEKEFSEVRVEIMELREDWRIESRNREENLDGLQNKSMLLFILLSITTLIISVNQCLTWAHDNLSGDNHL